MARTMKAAAFIDKGRIEIVEKPVPDVGPNDALIRITTTTICGTDVHIWNWDQWAQKTIPVPMVVGHEFMGEVVDVGRDNKALKVGDRVVVRRESSEARTAGGIVLPDTAKEKPQEGEVIAVGRGKILDNGEVRPLQLKAGDRVLFGKYSGQTVKIDGNELLVMKEDDLFAVVEK